MCSKDHSVKMSLNTLCVIGVFLWQCMSPANGSVDVTVTTKEDTVQRLAVFTVGANPGIDVEFQLVFGDNGNSSSLSLRNSIPAGALKYSTTWKQLEDVQIEEDGTIVTQVRDYLYYFGQSSLLPVDFILSSDGSSTGVLYMGTLGFDFCYEYHFSTQKLYLGLDCPIYILKHLESVVYDNVGASLDVNATQSSGMNLLFSDEESGASCLPTNDNGIKEVVLSEKIKFDIPCKNISVDTVSFQDQGIHLFYNSSMRQLTVYGPRDPEDMVTAVFVIVVLVLFFTAWLFWTKDLHGLVQQSVENFNRHSPTTDTYTEDEVSMENWYKWLSALQPVGKQFYDTLKKNKEIELIIYGNEEPSQDNTAINAPVYPQETFHRDYIRIATRNRVVWDALSLYLPIILDIVLLVSSLNFMGAIQRHPALYSEEAILLSGDAFVDSYMVFWAYGFSIFVPIIISVLILYGSLSANRVKGFDSFNANVNGYTWFSWGIKVLDRQSYIVKAIIFFVISCISCTATYVFCLEALGRKSAAYILTPIAFVSLLLIANGSKLIYKFVPYMKGWYCYDTSLLILMRWLIEIMILTGIHATIPASIDHKFANNFKNAIGIAIGASISIITGRDITWILHLFPYHRKISTFRYGIVVLLSLAAIAGMLIHCAVFLCGAVYIDTQSLKYNHSQALACSIAFTIQLASVGSIWSSHKFIAWKDNARGK